MDGLTWEGTGYILDSKKYEWKPRIMDQPRGWNSAGFATKVLDQPKREWTVSVAVKVQWVDGEKEFTRMKDAAAFTGLTVAALSWQLRGKTETEYKGFKYYILSKKFNRRGNGFLVTKDGVETKYLSIKEAIDILGKDDKRINLNRIYPLFKDTGLRKVTYHEYTFEKL